MVQWTDWDHIRRSLICKSNEVPEIESYGAHVKVNWAASILLPDEVIMKKFKSSVVWLMLATVMFPLDVYFLCPGSTLTDRLSFQTDDGQHSALLSSEGKQSVKWRDKVTQTIRTHKFNFVHTAELHVWANTIQPIYIRQYLAIGYNNNNNNNRHQWDASGHCLTQPQLSTFRKSNCIRVLGKTAHSVFYLIDTLVFS